MLALSNLFVVKQVANFAIDPIVFFGICQKGESILGMSNPFVLKGPLLFSKIRWRVRKGLFWEKYWSKNIFPSHVVQRLFLSVSNIELISQPHRTGRISNGLLTEAWRQLFHFRLRMVGGWRRTAFCIKKSLIPCGNSPSIRSHPLRFYWYLVKVLLFTTPAEEDPSSRGLRTPAAEYPPSSVLDFFAENVSSDLFCPLFFTRDIGGPSGIETIVEYKKGIFYCDFRNQSCICEILTWTLNGGCLDGVRGHCRQSCKLRKQVNRPVTKYFGNCCVSYSMV